jgi:hypothetical protein
MGKQKTKESPGPLPPTHTKTVGCQWLMPIILAAQEAEIRRIMV